MTEDEKKRLALEFFAAEQAHLSSRTATVLSTAQSKLEASLAHTARRRAVFDSLAQKGITWEELRDAYNEEFQKGHNAMLDHHLSYFYAGLAIAFRENHSESTPEEVAAFVRAVYALPANITDRKEMIQKCLDETGIDVSSYDEETSYSPPRATLNSSTATRKDREAVARMRRRGITEADLAYERELGYRNGWSSGFSFSVCYGAAALVLYRDYNYAASEIEAFIDRLEELRYEEISAADIIQRAREEDGVDVSELGRAET